jgi:hypothetical protein
MYHAQSLELLLMLSNHLPSAARKIAPRLSAQLLESFVLGVTPLVEWLVTIFRATPRRRLSRWRGICLTLWLLLRIESLLIL